VGQAVSPVVPAAAGLLAPALFKALNSSLKCEFGVTLDIARPVALAQLAHSLHDQGTAVVTVPIHTNHDGTLPVPATL
jgi:hypothetical protein